MSHVHVEHLWFTPVLTRHFPLEIVPQIPPGQQEPLALVPATEPTIRLIEDAARHFTPANDRTPTVLSSWLTEGNSRRGHDLHVDTHQGGTHVAILWLQGDENAGGDLELWDPRWINPRLTGGKYTDSKHVIKFQPGMLIMFPATVWHSVTKYTGSTIRRSLNVVVTTENVHTEVIEQQLIEQLRLLSQSVGVPYDGSLSAALSVLQAHNARLAQG